MFGFCVICNLEKGEGVNTWGFVIGNMEKGGNTWDFMTVNFEMGVN